MYKLFTLTVGLLIRPIDESFKKNLAIYLNFLDPLFYAKFTRKLPNYSYQ